MNRAIISRHDRLFQTLARVARLCGIVVELEPRLDGKDKSRTDGHFFFHSITTHVDISVVNPTVKDYLKVAQQPLGAAHAREISKDGIYKDRIHQQGSLFFPFILETFGGIGQRAQQFIDNLVEEAALNGVRSLYGMSVKKFLVKALNVMLMIGNSHLLAEGCKRSRQRLADSMKK